MKWNLSCLVFLATLNVLAHEGHNHDAPTTLMPLKGGVIKTFNIEGNKTCFVEVVKSAKKDLKIFFFDTNQKSVPASDFQLTVEAAPYSAGKSSSQPELLVTTIDEKTKQFYKTSYLVKGAHRYNLTLKFTGPAYCKTTNEQVDFIID
jgi:hypothetical protein